MPIDAGILDRFMLRERKLYGGGRARFKEDEFWSKVRAFYIRIFNPWYLFRFITTLYPDTFFPTKKFVTDTPYRATRVEFHENVHKWDRWNEGVRFSLKYLFPQWVGIPFILAAVILGGVWSWMALGCLFVLLHVGLVILAISASKTGKTGEDPAPSKAARTTALVLVGIGAAGTIGCTIWFGTWFAFLWVPALLFTSPWPIKAFWRRDYEIRGYTMSLFAEWLKHGNVRDSEIPRMVKNFSGSAYFWMEPNGDKVQAELEWQVARFQTNTTDFLRYWKRSDKDGFIWAKDAEPYRMAHDFMVKEGLTREV